MNDTATKTPTEPSAAAAAPPKPDFPTWLPPMLVKELRQGLRARGFILSLIGLHATFVLTFVWTLLAQASDKDSNVGMANGFFWVLTTVMLVVVIPARGLGALRSEIEVRNVDLLMLTQLTSWRVVWGKWTSLVTQSALLLVTLLPYGVIRYFFGGVDLLDDLVTLVWLFVIGALATALTLWVSGVNRILRVLLIIVLVGGLNSLAGVVGGFFWDSGSFRGSFFRDIFGGSGGGGSSGAPSPLELLWLLGMVIVLLLFLVQAVRHIAPPSENHSLPTRLLALAMLLPAPFLLAFRDAGRNVETAMYAQLTLGLLVFIFVCALELATAELPMRVHVRQLLGRGGLARRFLCLFLLPGWTGAALFTLLGLTLFSTLALFGAFNESPQNMTQSLKVVRLFGLMWVAVVFPAAVMSLFVKRGKVPALLAYIVQHVVVGVLCISGAIVLAGETLSEGLSEDIRAIYHILPVTSFWFELGDASSRKSVLGTPGVLCQFAMFLFVALFVLSRSRPYLQAYRHGLLTLPPPK